MEKPSSLSYCQAPVTIGFILCIYVFRKVRNLSYLEACFTRQTDIVHGNEGRYVSSASDMLHIYYKYFDIGFVFRLAFSSLGFYPFLS